ncbi:MAG TPA: hypothetical protein VNQ55_02345 [Parapedobacter sp.]|nr:hypothetical protein [Parapedobacter sp.]
MYTKPTLNEHWIAVLRIGTGVVLLACFASLWPEYSRMYGIDGLADVRLFTLQHPPLGILAAVPAGTWWLLPGYLCLSLLLIAGLATRLTATLLLLLHYHLFTSVYAPFSYGVDYLASSCLLYCILFPANGYQATFFLRILQAHVCIIYFFAGLGKALGPTWHNGEALWKAVTQPGFESLFKPDLLFLGAYPSLWVAGGWAVLILELTYPVFIWLPPTRRYWLWAMVGLHLGIALLMGLYSFSALMIVLNLSAFYMPYLTLAKHKTGLSIPPVPPPATGGETPAGGVACADTTGKRPYV